jgi:hypothetical protein
MTTYDYRAQPDESAPLSSRWFEDNNKIALRIARNSTLSSRRDYLAGEFERLSNAVATAAVVEHVMEEHRGFTPDSMFDSGNDYGSDLLGGKASDSYLWNRRMQEAYGVGRALERAIQEARFGRVISREEMLALGDAFLKGQK